MGTNDDLESGRESYSSSAWATAYESFSRADQLAPLAAEDLELLATSVYMLGREDEWMRILERAFRGYSDAGETRRAVRCAFWIGIQLALRGEMGPATGWLGRAQRLLDREQGECVEQGYMLMPVVFQHEAEGDLEGAEDGGADVEDGNGQQDYGDPASADGQESEAGHWLDENEPSRQSGQRTAQSPARRSGSV